MLTFKEETHQYFWNDKEVPSVTQVIKAIGITRDYTQVDEFYRQRGLLAHQAIDFHVRGTLDESTVDPEIAPYLAAFRGFEKARPYVPRETEIPLYSQEYGFAGTIDQLGTVDNEPGVGVTDLKITENSDKAADLQLAGYSILVAENYGYWPAFRMALELHGDGIAKPLFYHGSPKKLWEAVMTLWEWKQNRRSKTNTRIKP